MEPVGMTNASASNVLKINARMKAMATASIVSRMLSSRVSLGAGFCAVSATGPEEPADGLAEALVVRAVIENGADRSLTGTG
jgi:hypothetical protein